MLSGDALRALRAGAKRQAYKQNYEWVFPHFPKMSREMPKESTATPAAARRYVAFLLPTGSVADLTVKHTSKARTSARARKQLAWKTNKQNIDPTTRLRFARLPI